MSGLDRLGDRLERHGERMGPEPGRSRSANQNRVGRMAAQSTKPPHHAVG